MQPPLQEPIVVESDSLSHKLEQIGRILRLIGWAGILTQLAVAIAVMLLFAGSFAVPKATRDATLTKLLWLHPFRGFRFMGLSEKRLLQD